ncbi:MAG: YjbH domain-containing protein [Rhodobacteraceae bacterium]|nr:YjbH domain-containing protein [Paracoccaceae bacterium]
MAGAARTVLKATAAAALLMAGTAPPAVPQGAPTLNLYGTTGLIDMPSAQHQADGTFNFGVSHFAGITRTTLGFQITRRLSGSFRHAAVADWNFGGYKTYYDRSFDLRFRLVDEGRYLPAVTVGLQDLAGTGLYAGEYVVATKNVTPRLRVTAGLGWGRLGTHGAIGSPFGDRPPTDFGQGGVPNWDQWFRGPVAPFGGIEWQVTDRIGVKVEYSSDGYVEEAGARGIFRRESPFNFGIEYQANPLTRIGAYYLYGAEVGIAAHFALDPRTRPVTAGILGPGPAPVVLRPPRTADPDAWSEEWITQADAPQLLRDNLATRLGRDGITVEALAVQSRRAVLRIRNTRYDAEAQAIGRAARALANVLPASVEILEIQPVVNGIPAAAVVLRRSDVEALEHAPDGAARIRDVTAVADAGPLPAGAVTGAGLYPKLNWSLAPFARAVLFNAGGIRFGGGARFAANLDLAPGLMLSTSITKRVFDNYGAPTPSDSVLPPVRSDISLYSAKGDPAIETLTFAWYGRPGRDLYSRLTVGYLERMFAGVSGELLWKPVDSRLALGVEVNYVKQRDFDQLFGLREYEVATGHVSAYYDFGNGFHGQVDVGRYLAGDWGATFTLDREFANGWRVGAFATLTDVSFEDFGEGSFDKGVRISIPVNWMTGTPSRGAFPVTLRPVLRDGGARLEVDGRLYESIRDYHAQSLGAQWERFWR